MNASINNEIDGIPILVLVRLLNLWLHKIASKQFTICWISNVNISIKWKKILQENPSPTIQKQLFATLIICSFFFYLELEEFIPIHCEK